jgi:hypothetical protein
MDNSASILTDTLIFKTNVTLCGEIVFIIKPNHKFCFDRHKASLFAFSEIQSIANKKKCVLGNIKNPLRC